MDECCGLQSVLVVQLVLKWDATALSIFLTFFVVVRINKDVLGRGYATTYENSEISCIELSELCEMLSSDLIL